MKRFLDLHSRNLCLFLALLIAGILSWHTIAAGLLPIADGQGYALRAFALFGFLHSGQFAHFAELLTRPHQSILTPHVVLFLLLPKALAGVAAYVILQNVVTNLLLAVAVFLMAQILNRPAWAPAIFLLCAVNNIALTDFYAFYIDMTYFACALLVIAFQMKAWRENRARTSVLASVLLGLLFFVKPANALIFFALYILSEIFYAVRALRFRATKKDDPDGFRNLIKQGGYKLLGFVPVLIPAIIGGGVQTILHLIDQNEVGETHTELVCTGLLRLFYFPLCLAVCYHVLLLAGLLAAAALLSKCFPAKSAENGAEIPMRFLVPILIAYFIFGEFFSFWMLVKPMRALLLVMPLFWFGFCWLWEKRRLRVESLLAVALIYVGVAFSQKAFNTLGTRDQLVEDNYQLTLASWTEMPTAWRHGRRLSTDVCDFICRDLPPTGIVCVNALEIRNALEWRLSKAPLLEGKAPPYELRNLFDFKGEYYDRALLGVNRLALVTFFPVQSSRRVWLESMGMVDYGNENWTRAQVVDMPSIEDSPIGREFDFDPGLTSAEVDHANASAPFATAVRADATRPVDTLYGAHLSRAQGWQLLRDWFDKRFR